ncbi:ribonuclease P protein component [Legionella adelaidensis]|uniref:ribonuclease P protein component n=1 Tax=Legionella adelaidensis TaxID=45056 RepID=UPI001E339796|nr:ribonuclease P protein component [Legionella adelaidensis]
MFQQAKKMVTSEFIVLYRDNEKGYARLGLALSKKVIPRAHERNRIKRLLRETFRTQQLSSVDIIVLGRPGVALVQNSILIAKLSKVWEKLKQLPGN